MTKTPVRRARPAGELGIVNAAAEALNSAPDLNAALEQTLELVVRFLGLSIGWIWLTDPHTARFYNAAVLNLPPYLQEPVHMTGSSCWCIEYLRDGELSPKNIDVMECSRLRTAVREGDDDGTAGVRYHASIPLYFQERALGIMNVAGPEWRKLTKTELRLLSTIAYQAGIAVERAYLAEESTRVTRAEERARLAREIHDTLAQGLTAIALNIEGAMNHIDSNPARARERLEKALAMTRESLDEARRSVLNLRAAPLAGRPLAEALAALARAFTSETGVRVHLRTSGDLQLPLRMESELYRVAQEALTNVRRHADASEVTISLGAGPRAVGLTIRDNGRGFDTKQRPEDRHGITGMRERAKLLGGALRVTSRPNQGATLTVTAPLANEGAT